MLLKASSVHFACYAVAAISTEGKQCPSWCALLLSCAGVRRGQVWPSQALYGFVASSYGHDPSSHVSLPSLKESGEPSQHCHVAPQKDALVHAAYDCKLCRPSSVHPVEVFAVQIMGTVLSLAQGRKLFPVLIQTGGSMTEVGVRGPEVQHVVIEYQRHPSLHLVEVPALYL